MPFSLLLLALGAVVLGGGIPAPAQAPEPNPLEGVTLYVDHDSPSWERWQAYERSGHRRGVRFGHFTRYSLRQLGGQALDGAAS